MKDPKFKLDQKVWRIYSSTAREEAITIVRRAKEDFVYYGFSLRGRWDGLSTDSAVSEDEIFATKEELLKSL